MSESYQTNNSSRKRSAGDNYQKFLQEKLNNAPNTGISTPVNLNKKLFPFQADIVRWALKRGRAAIFADTGLGKTFMQLEWARIVSELEGPVLILAPLAVAHQTVEEGKKLGIDVYYHRSQPEINKGITITNYEMLPHFDASKFSAIVLDESSILKSFDGKTRTAIIEAFNHTPFKLACSATPAPNDYMELGNHAEFLNIMTRTEMLAMFFVHDGGETQKWRLKGHAQSVFWKWLCSWAVNVKKPSDLGYENGDFNLPPLNIEQQSVKATKKLEGHLFPLAAATLAERLEARRETVTDRVKKAVEIIATKPNEQWLIWCNLNTESQAITKALKAVEVTGSQDPETKAEYLLGFSHGEIPILVTKPSIAGFGLNWQNCANVIFLGITDSFEEYYQAIRRCWRFGQKRPVNVYIVTADIEGAVVRNIQRKEDEANQMSEEMTKHMADITKETIKGAKTEKAVYKEDLASGRDWEMRLGDCVDVTKTIPDESIHYSIFSPPFASLYTYSNSDRDMGNCRSMEDFQAHFAFLVKDLFRVLKSGRLVSFHCMNLPTSKQNHGYIGIQDFRGDLIRMFQDVGFIYHSEVCIWKDPVTAMQRTKALGLLHKQLKKDSCMSRQGIPDYLVTMRKPGENPEPCAHTNETFPVGVWQKYASPVWMDINPSDTLQFRTAREADDERHICPLQLQVIRRAMELWTNPGDMVLSPFAGIGSEGFVALQMGRKFTGIELKESYWKVACKNLKQAAASLGSLFDGVAA